MVTTSKEWWDRAALLEAEAREACKSGRAEDEERYRLNARNARNAARLAECQERQSSGQANESVSMTTTEERIAAIRMALEAGPTSGEWSVKVDEKYPQFHRVVGGSLVVEGKDGICEPDRMNDRTFSEDRANMAYIAACNPVAMAAVLAEIDRLIDENATLTEEKGQLIDENSDLRHEPWPEWASSVLKVVRGHSGYDGYDDAAEGVDMPAELEETLSEYVSQIDRLKVENERMQRALGSLDWYCPEDDTSSDACADGPGQIAENCDVLTGEVFGYSRGGVVETRYYGFLEAAEDAGTDDRFEVDELTREAAEAKINAELLRRAALATSEGSDNE